MVCFLHTPIARWNGVSVWSEWKKRIFNEDDDEGNPYEGEILCRRYICVNCRGDKKRFRISRQQREQRKTIAQILSEKENLSVLMAKLVEEPYLEEELVRGVTKSRLEEIMYLDEERSVPPNLRMRNVRKEEAVRQLWHDSSLMEVGMVFGTF